MAWTDLENRLAQKIGLEHSSLGTTVFRRAIGRRMRARDAETLPDYARMLDADATELQALVEELVVRESWFFRHATAFELLGRYAASTILERPDPYRVLSFPCAGGEEAYSIVISLREAGLGFHQFLVDAADISATALHTARAGRYGSRRVRLVAPAIQNRYFQIKTDSVEVRPEIRQAVRFTQGNIVEHRSVPLQYAYDAIFCRNLVIYLTHAARQKIIRNVNQWLSPDGLFFVGHAEMLKEFEELFEPVDVRGAFAYRRRSRARSESIVKPMTVSAYSTALDTSAVNSPAATPSSTSVSGQFTRTSAASCTTPTQKSFGLGRPPRPSPISQSEVNEELLRRASELSHASRHSEAIEACRQQLRQKGPSPQVYHLLGMVLQAAGLYAEATQALERATYLDPNHEEALLALALLARRRGDSQVADRLEQRSRRSHDRSKRS